MRHRETEPSVRSCWNLEVACHSAEVFEGDTFKYDLEALAPERLPSNWDKPFQVAFKDGPPFFRSAAARLGDLKSGSLKPRIRQPPPCPSGVFRAQQGSDARGQNGLEVPFSKGARMEASVPPEALTGDIQKPREHKSLKKTLSHPLQV